MEELNKIEPFISNLLLYNNKNEIVSLLRKFQGSLSNGVFNDTLKYLVVNEDVFNELTKKYEYSIRFKDGVSLENISIQDFTFELLPPPPKPKPSKDELLATALMETELQNTKLNKQSEALATGLMDSTLEGAELKQQVQALSKAVFELTLKR